MSAARTSSGTAAVEGEASLAAFVLELLSDGEARSLAEIRSAVLASWADTPASRVQRVLRALVDSGDLFRPQRGYYEIAAPPVPEAVAREADPEPVARVPAPRVALDDSHGPRPVIALGGPRANMARRGNPFRTFALYSAPILWFVAVGIALVMYGNSVGLQTALAATAVLAIFYAIMWFVRRSSRTKASANRAPTPARQRESAAAGAGRPQ